MYNLNIIVWPLLTFLIIEFDYNQIAYFKTTIRCSRQYF